MSDLIKREDAIEALNEVKGKMNVYAAIHMQKALNAIPSATQPKEKWIKNDATKSIIEAQIQIIDEYKKKNEALKKLVDSQTDALMKLSDLIMSKESEKTELQTEKSRHRRSRRWVDT